MQKIYLEKAIDLQNQLKELIALSVDESINYKIENEGIRAVGNLIIKGEYLNTNKEIFEETLELDILATFDKILDQRDFSIKVEDFDYTIRNGNIDVTIEAGVHGVVSGEDRYVNDDPVGEIENLIRDDSLLHSDPLSDVPELSSTRDSEANFTQYNEASTTYQGESAMQTEQPYQGAPAMGETPVYQGEKAVQAEQVHQAAPAMDTIPAYQGGPAVQTNQVYHQAPVMQQASAYQGEPAMQRQPVTQEQSKTEQFTREEETHESAQEVAATVETPPLTVAAVETPPVQVASVETPPVQAATKIEKRDEDKKIQEVAKDIDEQLQETVYASKSRPIFQDTTDSVGTYYLYIVQEEDTYQTIAERYASDEVAIKDYNQNRDLEPGSVLIIPYAP